MAFTDAFSPAALSALKRHQLVSLSKKYGLRASGKNVDMIDRLQDCKQKLTVSSSSMLTETDAASIGPGLNLYLPEPAPTPAVDRILSPSCISDPASPTPAFQLSPCPKATGTASSPEEAASNAELAPPRVLRHKPSTLTGPDAWEVLSDDAASLVSPDRRDKHDSVRSWRSAENGEAMSDLGNTLGGARRRRSSMLDFAVSLKDSASRTLNLGRSDSQASRDTIITEPQVSTPDVQDDEDEVMEYIAPSPASTVGVARRHSRLSLMDRPSTLRLCSPTPDILSGAEADEQRNEADDVLPFVGSANKLQMLKERRSMAPLGSQKRIPSVTRASIGRISMPALHNAGLSGSASIYPSLPNFSFERPHVPAVEDYLAMPGAMPARPTTPHATSSSPTFGTPGFGVSTHQFSEAAQALLKEMNAKLPSNVKKLDDELLKGKRAEIKRLVSVNNGLGEGGWGLGNSVRGTTANKPDRFAQAHEKEFARMQSIDAKANLGASTSTAPQSQAANKRKYSTEDRLQSGPSAPNGLPLLATSDDIKAAEAAGHDAKRTKLSKSSSHMFDSLRGKGKSLVGLLAESEGVNLTPAMSRRMKEKREKRRSSLMGRSGTSRFGFLSNLRKSIAPGVTTQTASAPSVPAQPAAKPDGRERQPGPKDMRRRSTELANLIRPSPSLATGLNASTSRAPVATVMPVKRPSTERTVSASTKSLTSSTRSRPAIPNFATTPSMPALSCTATSSTAALGAKSGLGLPKRAEPLRTSSGSSSKLLRKASQADVIKNARRAPEPPTSGIEGEILNATDSSENLMEIDDLPDLTASQRAAPPTSMKRSSTLYQPTASSIARMQATVKPNVNRPLPAVPRPPTIPVAKPFGTGQSRSHLNMFESGFRVQDENAPPAITPARPALTASVSKPVLTSGAAALGDRQIPHAPSFAKLKQPSHLSSPGKHRSPAKTSSVAASRARARAAGVSAIKSRGNLKEEVDVQRRRTELRAKQSRIAEEKGLREMLINMGGGSAATGGDGM